MIEAIFGDKTTKPSEKNEALVKLLLENKISENDLLLFAQNQKEPVKASCMEAFEFATRLNKEFGSMSVFDFAIEGLQAKAPRLKWESAKVIGNLASRKYNQTEKAIIHLLENTEHSGTVVRWSAAFALSEIYKANEKFRPLLKEAFEGILHSEEKNSILKFYKNALK